MKHRRRHRLRPALERIEPLVLLSNITDLMALNADAVDNRALCAFQAGGSGINGVAAASSSSGFVPSTTSIAVPTNQGPQGTNLALMPTGTLTPRELKRQQFAATFEGHYTVGPGRTSTAAMQVKINGVGAASTMAHPDIQISIVKAVDPALGNSGVLAIFDRNLNSNTVLGLDFLGPAQSVDRAGRPNYFNQVSIDANESSGVYDEAYSQGIIHIRYLPSGKQTPGVLSQGTAIVKIRRRSSPRVSTSFWPTRILILSAIGRGSRPSIVPPPWRCRGRSAQRAVRSKKPSTDDLPLFLVRDGGDIGPAPAACGPLLDALPLVKAARAPGSDIESIWLRRPVPMKNRREFLMALTAGWRGPGSGHHAGDRRRILRLHHQDRRRGQEADRRQEGRLGGRGHDHRHDRARQCEGEYPDRLRRGSPRL